MEGRHQGLISLVVLLNVFSLFCYYSTYLWVSNPAHNFVQKEYDLSGYKSYCHASLNASIMFILFSCPFQYFPNFFLFSCPLDLPLMEQLNAVWCILQNHCRHVICFSRSTHLCIIVQIVWKGSIGSNLYQFLLSLDRYFSYIPMLCFLRGLNSQCLWVGNFLRIFCKLNSILYCSINAYVFAVP